MVKPFLDYSNRAPNNETTRRVVSGAFSQMSANTVSFLKESFALLDKNGDGTIDSTDLEDMLVSLGQDPSTEELEKMLQQMPQPLTFPSFLSAMSQNLAHVSDRQDMLDAFEALDDQENGERIPVDDLRAALFDKGMNVIDIDAVVQSFSRKTMAGEWFLYKDFVETMRGV